jgi:hypothetical protein
LLNVELIGSDSYSHDSLVVEHEVEDEADIIREWLELDLDPAWLLERFKKKTCGTLGQLKKDILSCQLEV